MATREKGGRVVFIGNIPYGVSEEQIMDIFGRCGQVQGFRLVYDKDTGQPKGFGFLEYNDTDSAQSAIRNLNEFELNGRTLRVDFSNDNRGTKKDDNQNSAPTRAPPPAHLDMAAGAPAQARPDPGALPPLPPGVELPPGVTAFDAISKTLSALPPPQLLDFISQLKNLCASNPAQATALLTHSPQLGYAVFQAMLLLELVDTNIVHQLVATTAPAAAPPPAQHPPPQAAAPPPTYAPQPPQAYPPQPPPGYPPQAFPPPMPHGYPPGYAPTPPAPTPAYQPPIQQQAPPPAAAPPSDQAALYQQVASLTREQINALPEQAKAQIIAIRQQMGMPV